MDIYHLRYFLAVARELNFTRAAQNLHMSVAPLSQRIKSLESELGEQLFDRSTHHVALTSAGERLASFATTIVADFDAIPQRLAARKSVAAIRLSVPYALNAWNRTAISNSMTALSDRYTFSIRQVSSKETARRLHDNSIDLGVSRVRPTSKLLNYANLSTEELVILVDASAFPGRRSVTVSDLKGFTYVPGPEYWEIDEMLEAQHTLFRGGIKKEVHDRCLDLSSMLVSLHNCRKFTLRSLESEELRGLDPAEFSLLPIDDINTQFGTMLIWRAADSALDDSVNTIISEFSTS